MAGPRVFTLEEANEILPTLEQSFDEIDEQRDRLRIAKIKLNALEMIWGAGLQRSDCTDHEEARALVTELEDLEKSVGGMVQKLAESGAVVKDVHLGLVDLYHVHEGQLVFLCWKRGEEEIIAWHHVDTGFSGRQSL
ncbi:MAG: hypothetical protein ACI9EF_001823 [Pseudohongiellaceae bacterium]|jgi:hypothetical protein